MVRQKIYSAALIVVLLAGLLSLSVSRPVAAAQLSGRSIKMSSAVPGSSGNTYTVSFTTSGAFQSLIIDFCADSPIVGSSSCTNPTGMSVASPTVNFTTGTIGTVSTTGSSSYQLKVSGSASQAAGNIVFTVANVTNPSATGTFYARVYTYSNASFGTPTAYSGPGAVGSTVDYGGEAMSTASTVNLSATIQETLTFCVSGSVAGSPPTDCNTTTSPAIALGSGIPRVLGGLISSANAYMVTSTNALSGVSIAMKNNNSCGGLSSDGGSTCPIAPVGATAAIITNNSGKFGMYLATSGGGSGAAIAGVSPYNTFGSYGMDNTTAGGNVSSIYGDQIGASSGPTSNAQSTMTFSADTAPTTPAGIYTATMTLIATGMF